MIYVIEMVNNFKKETNSGQPIIMNIESDNYRKIKLDVFSNYKWVLQHLNRLRLKKKVLFIRKRQIFIRRDWMVNYIVNTAFSIANSKCALSATKGISFSNKRLSYHVKELKRTTFSIFIWCFDTWPINDKGKQITNLTIECTTSITSQQSNDNDEISDKFFIYLFWVFQLVFNTVAGSNNLCSK